MLEKHAATGGLVQSSGSAVRPLADVAVVGAGPAGSVAALSLARAGHRVLLLGVPPVANARRFGESLIGGARPLLRDLELLSVVEQGPHLPCYGNASAWGDGTLVTTDFIRDPNGPGWHLDRATFDNDVRDAAIKAGAIYCKGRVCSVKWADDVWQLNMDRSSMRARWLIDATGRSAMMARRLGIARSKDDRLCAIYAWFAAAPSDHDARTLIEAVEHGWWYSALLPGRVRVAILHVDSDTLPRREATPRFWHMHIARTTHLRAVLSDATCLTMPRATAAGGTRLAEFAGDRWLAAGDAAMAFDPLSSRGIFNSLYSGMRAAQAVASALGGDGDAPLRYAQGLERIYSAYQTQRHVAYGAEQRWLESPFWTRRALR